MINYRARKADTTRAYTSAPQGYRLSKRSKINGSGTRRIDVLH
jgi:hypothetical protein